MLSLGKDSFWEMSSLAMAGGLASCESCVEHFYFQSQWNARAFLESCAAGGLVEKISLLDLFGDFEPRNSLTLRQAWYDQPIYVSAPEFRRANATVARKRIENTKKAVYAAFQLYYERLGANDRAISAAYANAVKLDILRHSETAKERVDVNLSGIAKLRLILDAFRKEAREVDPNLSKILVEKKAADQAVAFVNQAIGEPTPFITVSDRTEELAAFVDEFLNEGRTPKEYWHSSYGEFPSGYQARWVPVILELATFLYHRSISIGNAQEAEVYATNFTDSLQKAADKAQDKRFKESLWIASGKWSEMSQCQAA